MKKLSVKGWSQMLKNYRLEVGVGYEEIKCEKAGLWCWEIIGKKYVSYMKKWSVQDGCQMWEIYD